MLALQCLLAFQYFFVKFILLSASPLNLDQSKNLLFGKELTLLIDKISLLSKLKAVKGSRIKLPLMNEFVFEKLKNSVKEEEIKIYWQFIFYHTDF